MNNDDDDDNNNNNNNNNNTNINNNNITLLVSLFSRPVCCGWWVSHNNGKNKSDQNIFNLKYNLKSCLVYLQDITWHVNTISDLYKCGDSSAKCIYKCESERC